MLTTDSISNLHDADIAAFAARRRWIVQARVYLVTNRAKMGARQAGKRLTDETKAKISAKALGRKASAQAIEANRRGQTGRRHPEETRARMRQSKLCFAVRCLETGAEYPSVKAAARATGLAHASIMRHLCGASPGVRGFTFRRTDV